MSVVTDICILTSLGNGNDALEKLGFRNVRDHAGGNKALQGDVWLGAFNYLRDEEMAEALKLVRWPYDEEPLVLIQQEHDDGWSVWKWRP
jgi:hypothetical protein